MKNCKIFLKSYKKYTKSKFFYYLFITRCNVISLYIIVFNKVKDMNLFKKLLINF